MDEALGEIFCSRIFHLSIIVTLPHQSEAPVRGRTGFSKIGGLLASLPSVSCPNFRAASLRKIISNHCRKGTLATQAKKSVNKGKGHLPWVRIGFFPPRSERTLRESRPTSEVRFSSRSGLRASPLFSVLGRCHRLV